MRTGSGAAGGSRGPAFAAGAQGSLRRPQWPPLPHFLPLRPWASWRTSPSLGFSFPPYEAAEPMKVTMLARPPCPAFGRWQGFGEERRRGRNEGELFAGRCCLGVTLWALFRPGRGKQPRPRCGPCCRGRAAWARGRHLDSRRPAAQGQGAGKALGGPEDGGRGEAARPSRPPARAADVGAGAATHVRAAAGHLRQLALTGPVIHSPQ